ncbi:ABC transporter ATP-binding protein [Aeromicrobium sp. CTD01-1L150]|uniref:ABC transporter ATP-binding protein n=1 Tax=Aeromicrobium sp. CTD01-1L150 TaxID=3341830 RepID=UPI0035C16AB7
MTVDVQGVSVDLGGRTVVDDVSLATRPGQVLGLLGPNGSGKSTLLRTLFRALRPRSGHVRVDGDDVADLGSRELARRVAVMLQDAPTEFDMTVTETVALGRVPHHHRYTGPRDVDRRAVEDALAESDLLDLRHRMVRTLSGGQRQRTMLARALAQDGDVLVLDEPTNHLDVAHQLDLMHRVRRTGRTTVAALHDMNLAARFCDSIAVLDRGRLVAHGPATDVLTPRLVRDVFGVEARVLPDPLSDLPVIVADRVSSPSTTAERPS